MVLVFTFRIYHNNIQFTRALTTGSFTIISGNYYIFTVNFTWAYIEQEQFWIEAIIFVALVNFPYMSVCLKQFKWIASELLLNSQFNEEINLTHLSNQYFKGCNTHNISGATVQISVLIIISPNFDLGAQPVWLRWVVRLKHVSQVFHHQICVIISLKE